MKLVLNNSTLEIMSHQKENRNKETISVYIKGNNTWIGGGAGYFIDVKAGDVITITPNQEHPSGVYAFTSTKDHTTGETPTFANGTSSRLNVMNNVSVIENCYLYIMTSYGQDDYTPESVEINGFILVIVLLLS